MKGMNCWNYKGMNYTCTEVIENDTRGLITKQILCVKESFNVYHLYIVVIISCIKSKFINEIIKI